MSEHLLYEERKLLMLIAEGDETAFASLYRYYGRRIFPFLLKLTGSEVAAEDVMQNTFLSLWLNRMRLPEIENFSGYVYRAAGNQAYTWLTKNKNVQVLETAAAGASAGSQDLTSQEVHFREAQRLINEAVNELPGQRKKIFRLYREGGYSYNEIAEQLNLSPSTVRNSVAAALDAIRKKLSDTGFSIFFVLFFCSR